jgi:Tfp pilus assembly protein PilO
MRFFLLLLLIASLATIVFLGLPQWRAFQDLRVQQTVLERIALNTREVIEVRNQLLNRYNAVLTEDKARLETLLPEEASQETIMSLLQELALRHGLLLKRIAIREATQQNPLVAANSKKKLYDELIVDMGVTGTYQSFQTFLKSIEQNARLLEIEAITFSAGEADSLEFSLQAHARFLAP